MSLEIVQIIEDEPLHAQLLNHSLRQACYRTNVACDGVSGLADVQRLNPSVVLLDLMLPGMTGQEVCHHIRNQAATRRTPIMIISALVSEEDRISGIEMGADDYLTKPFSPREVVSRVGSLLRRSRETCPIMPINADFALSIEDHCLSVSFRGKHMTLSRHEYYLLRSLIVRPDQVVTIEELVRLIAEESETMRECQLESLMYRLRTTLENTYSGSIDVLPRIGYRYTANTK